jgi:hypothetical protein
MHRGDIVVQSIKPLLAIKKIRQMIWQRGGLTCLCPGYGCREFSGVGSG